MRERMQTAEPTSPPRASTAAIAALCVAASCAMAPSGSEAPAPVADGAWRTDPAWYDGQAEKCVYEATRIVYGRPRLHLATAYTNKQRMDPRTAVKTEDSGLEVFKHHWSERVPTESYDYDFSTAVFVRTDDLSPFKLTAATQEDCGASFKQIWSERGTLRFLESLYLPGTGLRQGECEPGSQLTDALSLVLRDFPFDASPGTTETLALVASQKDTHAVPFSSERCTVTLAGRETLSLPVGDVDAWRLQLRGPDDALRATYWFAAEARAPWLRALVQYEDAHGTTYRLRSIERTAYWERR